MLDVTVLGQFRVVLDDSPVVIPTRNAQSLFAYLILNAGKPQRRERLAGILWPDSSEENARSNLRHEIWRLRKSLGSAALACLISDDLTLMFNAKSDFQLDVHQFENGESQQSAAELIASLSVYTGELLPGFYDEWATAERVRLGVIFEKKLASLLEILEREGRWTEILEWANRWISFGSWPEPAYRALIYAHANLGDLPKAAATYERLEVGLQKDLGISPSEQTLALYKRIRSGWKSEQKAHTVPPAVDRAAQKDQASAVLGLVPPRPRRSNIPTPRTSFIGRENEIREILELIHHHRLVTITGSGGVGKTRLAIKAAEALVLDFNAGVCWVGLASLHNNAALSAPLAFRSNDSEPTVTNPGSAARQEDMDVVVQALAKPLRVPESPGIPLLSSLIETLHTHKILIIFDNCEHMIEACAFVTDQLLGECPQVSLLATSREALGVPGERAWALPTLSLPPQAGTISPKQLLGSEAIRLFVERTTEIQPEYRLTPTDTEAVAQICTRLDGIPLAIELAAARMNLLTAQEIALRLDRRFSLLTGGQRATLPRHQTLLAAIEWSFSLLNPAEQTLFQSLSIFAGSFNLEAAESICASERLMAEEVVGLLGRLVDKSLLKVESTGGNNELATRFRMLDTIRSFGRLKLEESDETGEIQLQCASYYVNLVENAAPNLILQNQGYWYRLLQAENDNIRAVIEWSIKSGQTDTGLRIVGALLWYWWSHGSSYEGRDLTLKVLELPEIGIQNNYRGRALNTAAYLGWVLGDYDSTKVFIQEALALLRETDDQFGLAWSMQFLGLSLASEGKYTLAAAAMEDGETIARQLGDINNSSFSLAFRGDIAYLQGDFKKSQRVYEESVEILRKLGNKLFTAYPLRRLGYIVLKQEDYFRALAHFKESLLLNVEGGDKRAVLACVTGYASLALELDQIDLAARLYGAVESQLEALQMNLLHLDQTELDSLRNRLLAKLDEPSFQDAFAEGWEMDNVQSIDAATSLETLDFTASPLVPEDSNPF